ncbi:MAG: hypothetical protein AB8B78_05310 [Polaribacter sp.]
MVTPIESESKAVFFDTSKLVIFGPPKTSFSNKRLLVTFIVSKTKLPVYNSFKFLKSSNPCKVTTSYVLLSVVVFKISIFSILEVSILLSLSKSFAVILWSPSIKACIKFASVIVVYCTVVQLPSVLNCAVLSNFQIPGLLATTFSSTVTQVRFGLSVASTEAIFPEVFVLLIFLRFKLVNKPSFISLTYILVKFGLVEKSNEVNLFASRETKVKFVRLEMSSVVKLLLDKSRDSKEV